MSIWETRIEDRDPRQVEATSIEEAAEHAAREHLNEDPAVDGDQIDVDVRDPDDHRWRSFRVGVDVVVTYYAIEQETAETE